MSDDFKKLTTKEKALQLNLDPRIYGTIAEIGGGQEVAGHFFKAGGASGSIAKTMSAYDMTFSDAIYGKTKRYVSLEKLMKMLDKEYELLTRRLTARAKKTNFFAFSNTVETLNYRKTNDGHGWIGLRFQLHPSAGYNDCVIHINLKDNDALWQQQVLGMVGVNMIHACYHSTDAEEIMNALGDNISRDRFEIDMFRIEGPDFHHVDQRVMTLKLVKNGLTQAAMFDPKGNVMQASQALYKKDVVVLRGRFRPATTVHVDMMISGMRAFRREQDVDRQSMITLTELTLHDLSTEGDIDEADFLDRVDCLCSLGQNVMISNYQEHYRIAAYLSKFTRKHKLGIIIGLNNLERIFDESYYDNLSGGILESFSRLFSGNVRLYVYPSIGENGGVSSTKDFEPAAHLRHLYQYLVENDKIRDLPDARPEHLHIISDNVAEMIRSNESGWEKNVPQKVAQMIKAHHMFNFPFEVPMDLEEDYMNIEEEED
ncbi:MAG: TonB-dependent receptor [Bacteroidota bacterium]